MAAIYDPSDPHDGVSLRVNTPTLQLIERKPSATGLISRFFARHSSTAKENSAVEMGRFSQDIQEITLSAELRGLVTPCPFIRPLEHRLQPRTEPMRLKHRPSIATINDDSSSFEISRTRAKRMLTNRLSDDDLTSAIEEDLEEGGHYEYVPEDITEERITRKIYQQQEYVAVLSAQNALSARDWKHYVQCYSKGQFNLNCPPAPPPRCPSFQYLPAIFPEKEARRMSFVDSYDILWPNWEQGRAGALLRSAMVKFDTRFAALSFFDGEHEMFKVENGYNCSKVDRSISIAAHALLSADVLVLLDTKQDWRFENNPLVIGKPNMRFFAGAPMLAANGQAVGVVGIFGREPRTEFSPLERRELAEFASLAMTDLTLQAEWLADPELRSTPLLQRDSIINGDYKPCKVLSILDADSDDLETGLMPPALRYHKVKTPPRKHARLFVRRDSRDILSSPTAHTPPSSGESDDGKSMDSPRGFGKNRKMLPVNSGLDHDPSFHDLITPDSRNFEMPPARPFSSSDITSLNIHPPNTPAQSLVDGEEPKQPNFDLSIEDFMSLSDNDCAEEPQQEKPIKDSVQSSPLIDLSSPPAETQSSEAISNNNITTVAFAPSRHTMASIATNVSSRSREVQNPMAEAAFACAFSAQSLGYDLIYAVEIHPTRQFMTDEELHAPGGLQKKIVVAYGLEHPMELSSDIHLRVVRSRGYETWENHRPSYHEEEYRTGYLIPLHSEGGPRRLRSSGMVLGAFRKAKHAGGVLSPAAEIERLLDAAHVLRSILLKPTVRRKPKRSNTEPSAPRPYPANEAIEVGKYSFDAVVGRR